MNKFHPFFALAMILFTACSTQVISELNTSHCEDFENGTQRMHYGEYKQQWCDKRDGKKYVYVTIGYQTWMAENLNYNAMSSKCYDDYDYNCTEYGRLYSWAVAKLACPNGWHLPSDAEWDVLVYSVGGYSEAGTRLKATSGWDSYSSYYDNYEGTDDYGFSALPGGSYSYGTFGSIGSYGYWWSATESNYYDYALNRYMYYGNNYVDYESSNSRTSLISVRCVQD